MDDGVEDTEHFLLLCLSFVTQQRDLLAGSSNLLRPFVEISNLSNDSLVKILYYGDRSKLQLTISFIRKNCRFD